MSPRLCRLILRAGFPAVSDSLGVGPSESIGEDPPAWRIRLGGYVDTGVCNNGQRRGGVRNDSMYLQLKSA